MTEAVARKCDKCGADITPEQLVQKQAGLVHGVLMCPACVDQKRKELIEAQRAAQSQSAGGSGVIRDITEEKISLVADPPAGAPQAPPKIRSFAESSSLGGAHHEAALKRGLAPPTEPATRCRTFHSKLTPAALAHMDDLINQWIDSQNGVYIKNVAVTVGMFEAKLHAEPHLVLTIFY